MSESWSARTSIVDARAVSMSQAASAARSLRLAYQATDPKERSMAIERHFATYMPPHSGSCPVPRV